MDSDPNYQLWWTPDEGKWIVTWPLEPTMIVAECRSNPHNEMVG